MSSAFAFTISACDSGLSPITASTPVATVTVSPGTTTVPELSNATLTAVMRDAAGRTIDGRFAAWTSSDPSVVFVSNGLITGVSPGTATITAAINGKSGSAVVTVSPIPVAFVSLSAPSISVIPGVQGQLVASARSTFGGLLVGRQVSWTSSNPSIASVANGVITGVKPGSATITATIENLTATALATVTSPAFTQSTLAVGSGNTCALVESGEAYCWGIGANGQLGNGTTDSAQTTPTPVSGRHRFVSLAASGWTNCGLRIDGRVLCWGNGFNGGLGNGSLQNQLIPTEIRGERTYIRLDGGSGGSFCAIDGSQHSWCWGRGSGWSFSSGTDNLDAQPVSVNGGRTYVQASTGTGVTCLLSDGGVAYCVGRNIFGEQGNGTASYDVVQVPTATAGVHRFTRLFVGSSTVCGTQANGTAWCWGSNSSGQIGDSTTIDRATPALVAGTTLFERVIPGQSHTCGLTALGAAWCWGSGDAIGTGTGVTTRAPLPVQGNLVFTELSVGGSQSCGRTTTGIFCWGSNYFGGLGDGTRTNRLTPTRVLTF